MFFNVQRAFRLLLRIYIPYAHFSLYSEGRQEEVFPKNRGSSRNMWFFRRETSNTGKHSWQKATHAKLKAWGKQRNHRNVWNCLVWNPALAMLPWVCDSATLEPRVWVFRWLFRKTLSMCSGRSYKGVPDVFFKSVFRRVRVPDVIVCPPGDPLWNAASGAHFFL